MATRSWLLCRSSWGRDRVGHVPVSARSLVRLGARAGSWRGMKMSVAERLRELGLVLPQPMVLPPSVVTAFSWGTGFRVPRAGVSAWVMVSGFVNSEPGYAQTTAVLNAFSEVVVDVFGPVIGDHARTAIGVVALPLNLPVVVAAELQVSAN